MRQRIVELRARYEDIAAVRKRLLEMGARSLDVFCQVDTYFNVPSGEMGLCVINGGRGLLVYRPQGQTHSAGEVFLTEVGNPGELAALLKAALGIKCIVHRIREAYSWGDVNIYLDKISGLGGFVELQVKVSEGEEEEKALALLEVLRKLGISEARLIHEPYSELVREKSGL